MSTTDNLCASRSYQLDQLVECRLEAGHAGVHVGNATLEGSLFEVVQWTDADAISDSDSVSELPVWYSALPIGSSVRVTAVYGLDPIDAQLVGCVLDDHEQISALVLLTKVSDDEDVRTIMPWANVAAIAQVIEL